MSLWSTARKILLAVIVVVIVLVILNTIGVIDLGNRETSSGNVVSGGCGLSECNCCRNLEGELYYDCNADCSSQNGSSASGCDAKVAAGGLVGTRCFVNQ